MNNQHQGHDGAESAREESPKRRASGRKARFAAGLVLAVVLVALVPLALMQADPVRRVLMNALTDAVASQTGWRLEVGSLDGVWPFSVRLRDVRLADSQGQWLSISDARLTVLPWARSGQLLDLEATFSQVQVHRIPSSPPEPKQPPGHPLAFLDGLAPVPVAFSASIEVDGLRLDEPVAGRAMTMNVSVNARNSGNALSLMALVERKDGPSASAQLQTRLDPLTREASIGFGLEEAPGGLVSQLAGLGNDSPLSVRLEGAGPFAQWSARLTAARAGENILEGTMSASLGRASTDDARFGLGLSVRPESLPITGQVRATMGSESKLAFKGTLTSAGLSAPRWKMLVEELALTVEAGSARLWGDAGVDGLSPRLSFAAALSNPEAMGLAVGPLEVHGTMRADIDPAGPVSALAEVETKSLAGALAPLKVELEGLCRLRAALEGDVGKQDLSLELEGGLYELSAGKGETWVKLASALGREVTLQARARLDPQGALTLSQSRVAAKAFSAEASGTYGLDSTVMDLGLSLDVADLSLASDLAGKPLSGRLTATSRLRGNTSTPTITAKLDGARLAYEATRFDTAGAELEAEVQADGSSRGRVSASVSRGSAKLGLNTRFAMAHDRLGLAGLTLAGPGVDASGELSVGLATSTASGRLKAGLDFNRLGAFLNVPMSGSARMESVLTESGPRQDATVSLTATDMKGFGLIVAKAEVSGAATDLARAPRGKLTATVTGARMGKASLEALDLQVLGNGKEASFTLKAKGTQPEPFQTRTTGVFAPAPGGGRLSLDSLQASVSGTRLALVQPMTLTFGSEGFSLANLAMTVDTGRITASGEMKSKTVSLSADIREFPLELLGKAGVVEDVSGKASASLRVSGAPQNPKVNASVELSQVRYAGFQTHAVPVVAVAAEAEYSQGRVASHCRVTAGNGASLDARADIPARLSLSPAGFAIPGDAALKGSLQGTAELATLAAFSGQEGLDMRGILRIDLTAGGRLKAPEISGHAGIENGTVEYAASGTVLRSMVLRVEAAGSRISIREFSAVDASNGRISALGQMDFPPDGRFSLAMDIGLDKAALVRTDMVSAVLSGRLAVSGDSSGMLVKGKLSTGQVEVNIPERIPPDVTPVEVELVNAPWGMAPKSQGTPGTGNAAPLPIKLDLELDFPGRIFVRGYGLDSVWDGQLRVGGWAGSPTVAGDINVVRGRVDFFGKQFNLVRGVVSFTGGPPAAPRIDIDAQHQSADITADILVTGDAVHPKVSFSSVPPLPQDEILAQVLFGKSVSGLTVPQALQLAQAAAAFSGKGDAVDLMGKTRKLVGLDYLGIGSSKGGDAGRMSITAGKYISDKIYVETSQGLGDQGPKVSVQVEVFPNVTLDSTTGLDSKTSVGLNWKMDY